MRIKPIHIFIPIAALLAVGLLGMKRAAGFLTYFIRGLGLTFEGSSPVLRVTVAVQNPTNEQFVIRSIAGTLYVNNSRAGNISMFETVVINPNSQIDLPILVRLDLNSVVSDLVTVITRGSGNPMEVRAEMKVNANGFVSDLDLKYKVG